MSIETLLEAAKFLELQALQQQKAREDEFKEKLQEQLREQKTPEVLNSTVHFNNVKKAKECRPALIRPPMPSPSVPITVIPVPVAAPNHSPTLPVTTHSPPPLAKREAPCPQEQKHSGLPHSPQPRLDQHPTSTSTSADPGAGHAHSPLQSHQPHFVAQTANVQQHSIHRYTGPIVSPSLAQAFVPHPGTLLQPAPFQNGTISRSSPLDDSRLLDNRKRPGGTGTREVHNKLEKNRRAHLKECFETLKKNIPNIDEKKTSNLSVLRSALRYIQTLKRKEKEYEHDMERLAREKIATQQRLAELKNDLSQWMDVVEIDRVLRQTVQPEEDQASTSTASEGGDIIDDDLDEEMEQELCTPPAAPQSTKPELPKAAAPHEKPALVPIAPACITQRKTSPPPPTVPPARPPVKPAPPQIVTAPHPSSASVTSPALSPVLHPTVIAHSSVSHPSVIQTLNHVIQTPKRIAHLAPSTTSSGPVHLTPAPAPIGHITVHPVAHLPTLYSQPVAVTHTLNHAQLNGAGQPPPVTAAAALVGKHTAMGAQMVTHHTQLVGQTVLNPVTMVTMPSFPISTLKLA